MPAMNLIDRAIATVAPLHAQRRLLARASLTAFQALEPSVSPLNAPGSSAGGSTPAAKAACVRLCPSKYRWAHYRQNLALRPPLFAKSPQTSTIGSDENLNACSKGRQRRSPRRG